MCLRFDEIPIYTVIMHLNIRRVSTTQDTDGDATRETSRSVTFLVEKLEGGTRCSIGPTIPFEQNQLVPRSPSCFAKRLCCCSIKFQIHDAIQDLDLAFDVLKRERSAFEQ